MSIIFLMLFFLIGSVILGLAWTIVFWVASFIAYIVACLAALVGIQIHIEHEYNIWYLLLVVTGISYWVWNIPGSCFGYALFIWITGAFMLFRSAGIWKISG